MDKRNNVISIQSRHSEQGERARRRGCEHRWLVATPRGTATSLAVCRRCGQRRRFPNALEDALAADRGFEPRHSETRATTT
jgi:hypothetical protein